MPSLREKLGRKRNKTPKKAKSTGDLENAGSESNFQMSKDYSSQMSGIESSDPVDESREETASTVSSTTDSHVAKKKRFSFKKLRKSLTKKRSPASSDGEKHTSLVESSNGTVVLVQEYVTNEDLSSDADKNASGAGVRRTQPSNVHQSTVEPDCDTCKESGKTENTEEANGTVDEWRMSGLLDTVERSNSVHSSSSKTNLAQPSSVNTDTSILKGGQDEAITKPLDTSTPKPDKTTLPTIRFDLVASTPEALEEGGSPQNLVKDTTKAECKEPKEPAINGQAVQPIAQDNCDPKGTREGSQTIDAEEDKFVETHNLDYEYSSQDTMGDEHEAGRILQNAEGKVQQSEEPYTHSKQPSSGVIEVQLNVKFQNGAVASANEKSQNNEDKATICALEEAIKSGEMKINQDILANEVLVLNLAKDDWVIVDYNEANGEIIEIFDRSMEVK